MNPVKSLPVTTLIVSVPPPPSAVDPVICAALLIFNVSLSSLNVIAGLKFIPFKVLNPAAAELAEVILATEIVAVRLTLFTVPSLITTVTVLAVSSGVFEVLS